MQVAMLFGFPWTAAVLFYVSLYDAMRLRLVASYVKDRERKEATHPQMAQKHNMVVRAQCRMNLTSYKVIGAEMLNSCVLIIILKLTLVPLSFMNLLYIFVPS